MATEGSSGASGGSSGSRDSEGSRDDGPGSASDEGSTEQQDDAGWLDRLEPMEWVFAAQREVESASKAARAHDARGAVVGARRAAGMALNGPLSLRRDLPWGRSYVAHLSALEQDGDAPEVVRKAAALLVHGSIPGPSALVSLTRPASSGGVAHAELEAARDVIAHAYALVVRFGGARDSS